MDHSRNFIDAFGVCNYIPNLPLLFAYKTRSWLSFHFLHAKICDTTDHFIAYNSAVLLQKNDLENLI